VTDVPVGVGTNRYTEHDALAAAAALALALRTVLARAERLADHE